MKVSVLKSCVLPRISRLKTCEEIMRFVSICPKPVLANDAFVGYITSHFIAINDDFHAPVSSQRMGAIVVHVTRSADTDSASGVRARRAVSLVTHCSGVDVTLLTNDT